MRNSVKLYYHDKHSRLLDKASEDMKNCIVRMLFAMS